jgi:hypothetical protein
MSEYNFPEVFKTASSQKLLDIIYHPDEYSPGAVEAARRELENRNVSAEQLEAKMAELHQREEDSKAFENKVISVGSSIIDSVNPLSESPATERVIKAISAALAILFIWNLIKQFPLLKYLVTDEGAIWDASMIVMHIPLIVVPAASILIWLRKKAGWILVILFLTIEMAELVVLLLWQLFKLITTQHSYDFAFPVFELASVVGTLAIYGATTWVMAKSNLRDVYNISKHDMAITIVCGVSVSLFTIVAIFK